MLKNVDKEKIIIYFSSFFIPVIIWILVLMVHGMYPFGNQTIMTGDITFQFIDYLSYLKSVILTNNDFVYTFSKTIGGDMAGFSSYYMLSPFNLILLLFPNRMLPIALMVIIIVKCGFMSLFFAIMLNTLYGFKKESLIYAVTYSLTGYVIVYFQLYAYFDDMMLLPLIVIGIHRLIENPRKKMIYIFSLALSIVLNFYIGWMLCIFSVVYFLYQLYLQKKGKAEIISFIISSSIAGTIFAVVLIPTVLSLRGEKNSFHLSFYKTMDLVDFFSRFYTDSFRGNISSCLPNIYCGMMILVLLLFYFLCKKIERREKIASLFILIFFVINFYINTLNVVWHGFNRPIGFPYRYSFLFIFMILLLSYKGMINFEASKIKTALIIMWSAYIIYSVFILIKGSDVIGKREIIIDAIILMGISGVLLLSVTKKLSVKTIILLLSLVQFLDLGENIYHSMYFFEFEDFVKYQNYIDRVGYAVNEIKESDDGFYRIEKTFRRSHNDAMQFNYAGMSHYSSCEKKEVISYMKSLGFRDNGNWSFYDSGSTALVDSIFGIKYIISQYNYMGKKYKRFSKKYYDDEDYFTYMNQYALPLVYVATKDIVNVKPGTDNTFEFQNKLADSINGKKNEFFTIPEISEYNLENLTEEISNGIHIYKKIDQAKEAYIEYVIHTTKETDGLMLEAYFDAPDYQNARIKLNDDEKGEYFTKYRWSVLDLGKHDEGDTLYIKIIPGENELQISEQIFYYENMFKLKDYVANVKEQECTINKITSSHLTGTANLKQNGQIVFSFPYEESWEVYVDGEKKETEIAAGLLLSVEASAGEHKLELVYKPAGKTLGLVVSILGLIFLIFVWKIDYKKLKNNC